MKNTIFIIDTDLNNYQILIERLEQFHFIVHTFSDYQESLYGIIHLKPDLIIFNFQLYLHSERNFYVEKRNQLKNIPIIMISSSNREEELLHAFDKGAADYLIKPIQLRELEARIKAILRRIQMRETIVLTDQIRIGEFVLYPNEHELDLVTHKVHLSKREQQVLLLIIERKIISRAELLRCIWGNDYNESKIVDVIVCKLRSKLEFNPRKPQYIKTIKGFGYRFVTPNN
jgi:two-component system, OmpR family, alkaline phosphatase synthesis response regulator PhoP